VRTTSSNIFVPLALLLAFAAGSEHFVTGLFGKPGAELVDLLLLLFDTDIPSFLT